MDRRTQWDWPLAWAAFLLHNAEEVVFGLPAWSAAHAQVGWIAIAMPPQRFVIAVIALSVIVTALALWGMLRPGIWPQRVLRLFAIIMLANAASHLALSLWSDSVMPGLWTALLLLVPVMGRIVVRPGL
jgi:hypothetical protein